MIRMTTALDLSSVGRMDNSYFGFHSVDVFTEFKRRGPTAQDMDSSEWKFLCFGSGQADRKTFTITNNATFTCHVYAQVKSEFAEKYRNFPVWVKNQIDVIRQISSYAQRYAENKLCPGGHRKFPNYSHLKMLTCDYELVNPVDFFSGYRFSYTYIENVDGMPCENEVNSCCFCPPDAESENSDDDIFWSEDMKEEKVSSSEGEPEVEKTPMLVEEPIVGESGDIPPSQKPPALPVKRTIPTFFEPAMPKIISPIPPAQTPEYKKAKMAGQRRVKFVDPSAGLARCNKCNKYIHVKKNGSGDYLPVDHVCNQTFE